jgi:Uma2 family endonuclease
MADPPVDKPDLPEFMTWEELDLLPEEIARCIELWDGRVIWTRTGLPEHQGYGSTLYLALRQCIRRNRAATPEQCWRAGPENNVFLQPGHMSDFMSPDFVVYRCLPDGQTWITAAEAVLVGEVLSPSNTERLVEQKKARYARAGIPWYWEVELDSQRQIDSVRAYAVETVHGRLPDGVSPLRPSNYLLVSEWNTSNDPGMVTDFPFRTEIRWSDLEIV